MSSNTKEVVDNVQRPRFCTSNSTFLTNVKGAQAGKQSSPCFQTSTKLNVSRDEQLASLYRSPNTVGNVRACVAPNVTLNKSQFESRSSTQNSRQNDITPVICLPPSHFAAASIDKDVTHIRNGSISKANSV